MCITYSVQNSFGRCLTSPYTWACHQTNSSNGGFVRKSPFFFLLFLLFFLLFFFLIFFLTSSLFPVSPMSFFLGTPWSFFLGGGGGGRPEFTGERGSLF